MNTFIGRPVNHLRVLTALAALALLATLLLPGVAHAQQEYTLTGPATVSIAENAEITDVVATYTSMIGSDPQHLDMTGTDAGKFTLTDPDPEGSQYVLKFIDSPNFEMPADSDTDNVYEVTLTVRGSSTTLGVTITVTNVNEAPVIDDLPVLPSMFDPVPGLNFNEDQPADTLIYAFTATDVDAEDTPQSLMWSIDPMRGMGSETGDQFKITSSGELTFKTVQSYEDRGGLESTRDYFVKVIVTDSGGLTAYVLDFKVDLQDINEAPSFNSGLPATISVAENTGSNVNIGSPYTAMDPDQEHTNSFEELDPGFNILTYTLTGTGASFFAIDTSTGQLRTSAALDYEAKSSYSVTVNVRDSKNAAGVTDNANDDTINVTITVTNVNEAPRFTGALIDRMLPENSPVGTNLGDPVAATDPDTNSAFNTLTYTLSEEDALLFTIVSTSGQIKTKSGVTYDFESEPFFYNVAVHVHDGKDAAGNASTTFDDTINVQIFLINVNEAPVFASATTTRTVPENTGAGTNVGAPVTATDPDDDSSFATLTYTLTGTDASSFAIDTSTGQITTKSGVTYNYEVKSSYSVTVSVRDSKDADGNADTAIDARINVTINLTNVKEPGTVSFSGTQSEGSTLTAVLTDEDIPTGSRLWRWQRADTSTGTFVTISGATSSTYTLTAADVGKYLKADVSYMDGAGTDESAMAVTNRIGAGNAKPTFNEGDSAGRTLQENPLASFAIGAAVTATDADGDTLTYSLAGTDASSFTIITSLGLIATKPGVTYNFEAAKNTYTVTVRVTDGKNLTNGADTSIDDTITVTISLTNQAESPTINSGPTTITKPENTPASEALGTYAATDEDAETTLTWSLGSGGDGGEFEINSTGRLTFKDSPDFESPNDTGDDNVYNLTVWVSDGGLNDTRDVTVTVTNVDEEGKVEINGTLTGGETLTASVDDEDGATSGEAWRWQRSNTATGSFSNIGGATSSTYTLVAADVGKFLKARVTYTDPQGPGKSATSDTVGPIAASNAEPSFADDSVTRTVPENSATVTNVGTPVTATDSDSGDTLTYSLSGTDASSFAIDAGSGQIRTKSGVTYNFEATKNTYTVTVNVRDSKDAAGDANTATDDSITVTINLTNVNEAPVIDEDGLKVDLLPENWLITEPIVTFTATDVDAPDTMTWSIESSVDGDEFEINQSGELTFRVSPNFEMPTDVEGSNEYALSVTVTDAGGLFHTVTLEVEVADVNEAPVFETGPTSVNFNENQPIETVVATYRASDMDADTTFEWSVEGADRNAFAITEGTDGAYELKFAQSPNFESAADTGADNDYNVTVRVVDDGTDGDSGVLAVTRDVIVTVNDVNDPPVVGGSTTPSEPEIEFDAADAVVDLTIGTYTYTDEDRPADTIAWSVGGIDMGDFTINSNGVLSFAQRPNYEMPADMGSNNVYNIIVKANDGEDTTDYTVTVTVTPVEETPEITSAGASHTAPSFAEIEYDATAAPDLTVATYTARDEEDAMAITWTLGGPDAGDFTIDSSTGLVRLRERPNFEMPADSGADNVYDIIVKARDTTAPLRTRELTVAVTVTNVNERPDIDENFVPPKTSYKESEYDFTGTRDDVHTFSATDYDAMSSFTWSLSGDDATHLEIDSASGALTFAQDATAGPLPDFENPRDATTGANVSANSNTYTITVIATDNLGEAEEYDVVITVTNVNETPELTGTVTATVTLDEHDANEPYVTATLASYTARDEESTTIHWSLTGP